MKEYFQDIIEALLKKKANLREELEREFATREAKIDELLDRAGYEAPVVEEVATVEEISDVEEVVEATVEEAEEVAIEEVPCGYVIG